MARKAKHVIFAFLHYQWLVAIDNGGTPACRTELSINQRCLILCKVTSGTGSEAKVNTESVTES